MHEVSNVKTKPNCCYLLSITLCHELAVLCPSCRGFYVQFRLKCTYSRPRRQTIALLYAWLFAPQVESSPFVGQDYLNTAEVARKILRLGGKLGLKSEIRACLLECDAVSFGRQVANWTASHPRKEWSSC
jgi:hypothetical protein